MYSSLLALWNQGRYQIFLRMGFHWSVKKHLILQIIKNIELEL